jgi:hypothetical protein
MPTATGTVAAIVAGHEYRPKSPISTAYRREAVTTIQAGGTGSVRLAWSSGRRLETTASRTRAAAAPNSRMEWIGLPEMASKTAARTRMGATGSRSRVSRLEPVSLGTAGAMSWHSGADARKRPPSETPARMRVNPRAWVREACHHPRVVAEMAPTVLIVDDQSGAWRHAEPRMVVDPGDHLALGAVFEQSRSGFRPPSDPDRPGTGEAR